MRSQSKRNLGRIRLKLPEILKLRGVVHRGGKLDGNPNVSALTRATGLSYDTCWSLVNRADDSEGISFDALAKLCHALSCSPADLLVYERLPIEAPTLAIQEFFQANPTADTPSPAGDIAITSW